MFDVLNYVGFVNISFVTVAVRGLDTITEHIIIEELYVR